MIQIAIKLEFKKEELREKFLGAKIRFYHSHLVEERQIHFAGTTEAFAKKHFKRDKTKNRDKYEFNQKFMVEYCFQKTQFLKCEIILSNTKTVIDTSLGEILGSPCLSIELPFFYEGTKEFTSLILKGKVVKDEFKSSFITLSLITEFPELPYSDYFVVVSNWNKKTEKTKVWKSAEMSGKVLNFTATMVTIQDLCFGQKDQKITFEFYGVYSGFVGKVDASLNDLAKINFKDDKLFIKKEDTKECKPCGFFRVKYDIENVKRFIDLIEKGLQISLTVAIDYTKSNGDPNDKDSLHYISNNPKELNEYELSIKYCGGIIAKYDFDKKFPVLGFGGINPVTKETSHNFSVNLKSDPYVDGVDNIIKVYRESLKFVKLDGPTYFSPLLKETIKLIKESDSKTSVYHILLIITDGVIHDFDETKTTIIKGSYLPFSVVIIGVGDANFKEMEILDGDDEVLTDKNGNKATRVIVQFVRFRDFEGKSPETLSQEVLREIPTQIEQYYRIYRKFVGVNDVPDNNILTREGTVVIDDTKDK